jgi:hypothetical protein
MDGGRHFSSGRGSACMRVGGYTYSGQVKLVLWMTKLMLGRRRT